MLWSLQAPPPPSLFSLSPTLLPSSTYWYIFPVSLHKQKPLLRSIFSFSMTASPKSWNCLGKLDTSPRAREGPVDRERQLARTRALFLSLFLSVGGWCAETGKWCVNGWLAYLAPLLDCEFTEDSLSYPMCIFHHSPVSDPWWVFRYVWQLTSWWPHLGIREEQNSFPYTPPRFPDWGWVMGPVNYTDKSKINKRKTSRSLLTCITHTHRSTQRWVTQRGV